VCLSQVQAIEKPLIVLVPTQWISSSRTKERNLKQRKRKAQTKVLCAWTLKTNTTNPCNTDWQRLGLCRHVKGSLSAPVLKRPSSTLCVRTRQFTTRMSLSRPSSHIPSFEISIITLHKPLPSSIRNRSNQTRYLSLLHRSSSVTQTHTSQFLTTCKSEVCH
jgi:hypothetical protein